MSTFSSHRRINSVSEATGGGLWPRIKERPPALPAPSFGEGPSSAPKSRPKTGFGMGASV
jgi:hypothetical protein